MSVKAEAITSTAHFDDQGNRTLTADHFPEYAEASPGLLLMGDGQWLTAQWPGGIITILGTEYTVIGLTETGNFLLRRGFHVHCGGCEGYCSETIW